MRHRGRMGVVALSLSLLASGCGHRHAAAKAIAVVGALTMVAGLLVAGDCTEPMPRDRAGQRIPGCTGTPDGKDTARGMAVVAAGATMIAVGAAVDGGERSSGGAKKSAKLRAGPYRARYRYAALPLPAEPEAKMEPEALPAP